MLDEGLGRLEGMVLKVGRVMVLLLLRVHSIVKMIVLLDHCHNVLGGRKGGYRLVQLNVSLVQVLLLDRRNISGLDRCRHQGICPGGRWCRLHGGQGVKTGSGRVRWQRGQTLDGCELGERSVERGGDGAGRDGHSLW